MKTCHVFLLGGGLDSTALLIHEAPSLNNTKDEDLLGVFVDYGQKAAPAEYESATYFSDKYSADFALLHADLKFSKSAIMQGSVARSAKYNVLSLRNPFLITLAASYATSVNPDLEKVVLYVGFHDEPEDAPFPDALPGYLKSLANSLSIASGISIEIKAPFKHMSRIEILTQAFEEDEEILTHTHTCYEVEPCGECLHCEEKEKMEEMLRPVNEQ